MAHTNYLHGPLDQTCRLLHARMAIMQHHPLASYHMQALKKEGREHHGPPQPHTMKVLAHCVIIIAPAEIAHYNKRSLSNHNIMQLHHNRSCHSPCTLAHLAYRGGALVWWISLSNSLQLSWKSLHVKHQFLIDDPLGI